MNCINQFVLLISLQDAGRWLEGEFAGAAWRNRERPGSSEGEGMTSIRGKSQLIMWKWERILFVVSVLPC